MNKLKQLLQTISSASQALAEAESARNSFLEPILHVLQATGGYISECSIYHDELYITRTGSTRGCSWNDDYKFPMTIFEHETPLVAAAEWVAAKKKAAEEATKREKLAIIRRLQDECGIQENNGK